MKSEKLSTEIAALQRKQKETKNAVAKKALSSKIERLKKELDEITTSAQAKTALAKAQSKIREMSQKDFGEFVKKLAAKPEFSFLKGMSKSKIKDDIMRVAKPVGWRFRGRTNVKKPTKKDIQEGNNVYYEGRVNRSDVSRTVRLAEGGGVGVPKKPKYKIGQLVYSYQNKDTKYPINYIKEADDLGIIRYRLSLPNGNSNWINEESIYGDKYANGGGVGEREKSIKNILKGKKYPLTPKELKDLSNKSGYSQGDIEYVFQKINNDLQYKVEYAEGGGVGDIKVGDKVRPTSGKYSMPKYYGIVKRIFERGIGEKIKFAEVSIHLSSSNTNIYTEEYRVENLEKVSMAKGGKTDFGMLSVKAGIDNNPNPTYADKIAGAKMKKMAEGGGVESKSHILQSYTPKPNEQLVLIENFDGYSYKVYAVYVDGEYDRRIKVSKYSKGGGVDMESVEEEIRSLRSRIKSLKEINTKEAYEQLYELTRQLSYLQAKLLHIKDLGYANGGGVGDISESVAKQSLMNLKESGEISQLTLGNHGQVFMSIKGGQVKSYDNYKDAYAHYHKTKYAKGGGVGENWENEIKEGDEVYGRWNDTSRWELGTFIGETKNGFEVYDRTIQRPSHIEFYAQISKKPYPYGSEKVFISKKFKDRNYNNYNFNKYATGGGVGLVNYGDYSPTVSYKIPDEELSNFIDYVYDVYKEQGYTKMQVKNAVNRYLSDLDKQYTWGYGDSLDRERVYEYLLNPKLKGIQNPSLAKGGDVQSSEPHRLHMMAKGGMTFSESVLKEGLSDMLHHLYKAQNELDGIMGYLDRTGQGGMKSALKSKFGLNSISETTEKIDTYLDK